MTQPKQVDYVKLSQRLDEVVAALESPTVSIDEAIALYEEGNKLVAELETYLKTAENRITKLKNSTEG